MMSVSLLASFCIIFHVFPRLVFELFFVWYYLRCLPTWVQKVPPKASDADPLSYHCFELVPQGICLNVLWLVLDAFWLHFDCFEYLFGTILGSKTLPFGDYPVERIHPFQAWSGTLR